MRNEHVLRFTQEAAWLILPSKLREICAFIESRTNDSDEQLAKRLEEWRASVEARSSRDAHGAVTVGSVGVVPIMGTMMRRANLMTEFSGGTSMQIAAQKIARLAADPSIKGILLEIDSPGGTHDGTPELAAEVARAAAVKPVFASANGLAASAAYWVASQATEFSAAPSASVGSIGTLVVHMDHSKRFEMAGVKPTIIRSGENKAEGNPYEPLGAGAKEHWQGVVDRINKAFVSAVAQGRGTSQAKVRENFGAGRVYLAEEAKARGMIDRVETIDETLSRLLRRVERSSAGPGPRSRIQTIRQFETFLRDEGGFSHAEAKSIAADGFKSVTPRDEAQETEADPELLEAVEGFVSDIKSLSRGG